MSTAPGFTPPRRHHPLRILAIILGTILVIAIGLGFAAGPLLKRYINAQLAKIPDYTGHVDGVSVSLLRGMYQLQDVKIIQRGHESEAPLVALNQIDVDLDYHEAVHGRVAAGIVIDGANLTIVTPKPSPAPAIQQKAERGQDVLGSLFPINISTLKVTDSKIHYLDPNRNPKLDFTLNISELTATGLTNERLKDGREYPAKLAAKATTTGNGAVTIALEFDPLASWPHFIFRVQLSHLNLPDFNDFLLAFSDADVSKGTLDLEVEMQANKGAYSGYAKPFFSDLDFKRPADAAKPMGKRIEKKVISAAAKLLKNHEGKVATTVPFQGNFDKGGVQVWRTIVGLLKNAFIQALREGFQGKLPPVPANAEPPVPKA